MSVGYLLGNCVRSKNVGFFGAARRKLPGRKPPQARLDKAVCELSTPESAMLAGLITALSAGHPLWLPPVVQEEVCGLRRVIESALL